MTIEINRMSDATLVAETKRIAGVERQATAELLKLLIEVERRATQLALGYSSMFVFCTRALLMSEQAAYSRITAARAARRYPQILERLERGELTLSSIGLLAPHLTDETVDTMLEAASRKSTRDVERLIAAWHPQPDLPTTLRAVTGAVKSEEVRPAIPLIENLAKNPEAPPTPDPPADTSIPRTSAVFSAPRPILAPLAPARYLLKLTITQDTHDKLQRARALLSHAIPDGDTDQILNRALGLLLDHVIRTKWAGTSKPRRTSLTVGKGRHIPAAVKREVWRRDGGRCVFSGEDGRCGETSFLEFHHVVPFAAGGSTGVDNLQLRCRAHNGYEAMRYSSARTTAREQDGG